MASDGQALPSDPKEFKARVVGLLNHPKELEERVRVRFREFAGTKQVLQKQEIMEITDWLAGMLQVHPSDLGEVEQMIDRYDFDGDEKLDEDEAAKMCMCMLRKYRDATCDQPLPGTFQLGGKITTHSVESKYDVVKKLGEGGQGAVYLASRQHDKKQVVVKYYDKSNPNAPLDDITAEFELMMQLQHPRIAHYFEIFQDYANIYVVTEPYFGGDLTTAMQKAHENGVTVTEVWLAKVLKQVLIGVDFLHSKDVMHCDLKEPNAMITGKEDWESPQVVVIDFGLANNFTAKSSPGGTPGYMPPEVWDTGLWTPKGDVFSLGVMLFSMRQGYPPFVEGCTTLQEVMDKTQNYHPDVAQGTDACKNLTRRMLEKNFRRRPPLKDILNDPWFQDTSSDAIVGAEVMRRMTRRAQNTDLKRALLADLAARANLAEMRELNDCFADLDKDNDGMVTPDEVRTHLRGKWSDTEIEKFISVMVGSDGGVAYEEFMGQLMAIKAPEENKVLSEIFQEHDTDRDGYLNMQELRRLLEKPAIARVLGATRTAESLMKQLDADEDGNASFEEFRIAMSTNKPVDTVNKVQIAGFLTFVGDKLKFYSETHKEWLPCTVIDINPKAHAVQVDVKRGFWIKGQDSWKLRKPGPPKSTLQKLLAACCGAICEPAKPKRRKL